MFFHALECVKTVLTNSSNIHTNLLERKTSPRIPLRNRAFRHDLSNK